MVPHFVYMSSLRFWALRKEFKSGLTRVDLVATDLGMDLFVTLTRLLGIVFSLRFELSSALHLDFRLGLGLLFDFLLDAGVDLMCVITVSFDGQDRGPGLAINS